MLDYFDIYEAEYNFLDDIKFLSAFSAKCNILELGCGTGRVIKYLITKGYEDITGLDICAKSITKASAFTYGNGVNLINSDAINYRSERKFDTIFFLFNGVMLINNKEDQKTLFNNTADNLNAGGRFVFYVLNPDKRRTGEIFPLYKYQKTINVSGVDVDKFEYSVFNKSNNIMNRVFNYDYVSEGVLRRIVHKFSVVYETFDYYKALLIDAGFSKINAYGDFNGEVYTESSDYIVVIAEK